MEKKGKDGVSSSLQMSICLHNLNFSLFLFRHHLSSIVVSLLPGDRNKFVHSLIGALCLIQTGHWRIVHRIKRIVGAMSCRIVGHSPVGQLSHCGTLWDRQVLVAQRREPTFNPALAALS